MKLFRTLLVAVIGAAAAAFAGVALLSAFGIAMTAQTTLYLVIGGFALGAAASQLESSALYMVLSVLVIVSMFSVFFLSSMPSGLWVTELLAKIVASSGWMGYAVWFGGHFLVAVLLSQWVSDPTLSAAEAIGKTVSTVTELVGSVTGSVAGGLLTGLFAAISNNPMLLVVGVAAFWYLSRGRYGSVGRVLGSSKASAPVMRSSSSYDSFDDGFEYETASLPSSVTAPNTPIRPQPANPGDGDPFFDGLSA